MAGPPEPARYAGEGGIQLELDAYHAEFEENFSRARPFWKLERGQHFIQTENPSWAAFARADWHESLRLTQTRRAEFADYHRQIEGRGMLSRRVRVAALPPSPYVQWELGVLQLRNESGHHTRIVLGTEITGMEETGRCPRS